MNKKFMTMLVACALSVSALSTTAVFAEDAVVTGDTPAVTETTPAYEPEISAATAWTGDNDIVFDVDAKGGTVNQGEMYVYDASDLSNPVMGVEAKVEVNEEGKGKITFTKDALKNAKTWDENFENQIAVDWTKVSKIEFGFMFALGDQTKSKTVYVEASVKTPAPTVTPTTPSQPTTPAKPAENKGTTTTTTTTKKEAPKTGDTMNVALYASLLLVSAFAAVVLTTKKRMAE